MDLKEMGWNLESEFGAHPADELERAARVESGRHAHQLLLVQRQEARTRRAQLEQHSLRLERRDRLISAQTRHLFEAIYSSTT